MTRKWADDGRMYEGSVTASSERTDAGIVLRSPRVGYWRSRPAPGRAHRVRGRPARGVGNRRSIPGPRLPGRSLPRHTAAQWPSLTRRFGAHPSGGRSQSRTRRFQP